MSRTFAARVLNWFEHHGRHDLPWQRDASPYRVWVSEIMLQQTQVATVVSYFERFMERFPTITDLAEADVDEVLHLWSGLGYYARARNLHGAARVIRDEHSGRFPETRDEVLALPGIGRSTAGAILALSLGQRHPILDGNVKRVLCRHRGIEGWPGRAATERSLWAVAEELTPETRVADYTQAMMDLGATLCRRRRPLCEDCPVKSDCVALVTGRQQELPAPRPRRDRPVRQTAMLLITDPNGRVLLERRADGGIWGGLWSFPELSPEEAPESWVSRRLAVRDTRIQVWDPVRHGFTHFELVIIPHRIELGQDPAMAMEREDWLWYNPESPARVGMAAVVERLLASIATETAGASKSGERDESDREMRAAGR